MKYNYMMCFLSVPEILVASECIVGQIERVGEILVVLPDIGKRNVEATGSVSFQSVVLHHPVEKIVRAAHVSAELSYSLSVVRNQASVYHKFDLSKITKR
jgi:hypothetical protein